jgi:uncharacterized protein (DUF433 family)
VDRIDPTMYDEPPAPDKTDCTGEWPVTTMRRLRPEIYRGRDPREIPTYTTVEAAHYLHVPEQTLRNWCFGRSWYSDGKSITVRAVIHAADPRQHMLSFVNLVELHVLDSIRRQHRVELASVRKAVAFLRREFKAEHPLADIQMETNGKDLFVDRLGKLVNVSREGQLAMRDVLDKFLRRIDRDPKGLAIRLFPFTRSARLPDESAATEAPRIVAIEPTIAFGRPVIAGSRIPTIEVAERFKAGDSFELLADEYQRPVSEIQEAIRCELAFDAA